MARIAFPVLVLLISSPCFSQNTWQSYAGKARDAYKAANYSAFYDNIIQANKLHPYHQGVLYQCGLAAALMNKPAEALEFLTRAINANAEFDLTTNDLATLQSNEDFQKLKQTQLELRKTIISSDTALVIRDRTAHIESISAGEAAGIFYLGSIHKRKILKVDAKGNVTDFTGPSQDGLTSVFGVKVDPKRKYLWACSSPMTEMENYDSTSRSAVYKYDTKSKKLLGKFMTSERSENTFGDLTLDAKGNVFVSDSKNNIIFQVDEKNATLEKFFSSNEFWNIQGITFSSDGSAMFIADYIKGIFKLDVRSKQLTLLPAAFTASMKSIDGLTFHNNSLIAIQNAIVPMRVTKYILNETQDKIIDYKIIDRGHPAFNEPTIGTIDKGYFYYVANSLWSGYSKDGKQKPADQLQDVVILRSKL